MEGDYSFIYDPEILNHLPGSVFFFTERIGVLHGELDGEGNGNPLQCSCLENSRDGGTWWASIYGVTQSRT